jgi:hypothetical protein
VKIVQTQWERSRGGERVIKAWAVFPEEAAGIIQEKANREGLSRGE